MIKMHSNGITVEVMPKEVSWYKRAGYEVVPDETPAPAETPEPVAPADVAPAESGKEKKSKR